jgi:hypothetical protein
MHAIVHVDVMATGLIMQIHYISTDNYLTGDDNTQC